jgi:hypothetical protein
MPGPEQLKPKDLVVGGRYLHVNRLFIRQIDGIEGDTVIYHDQYGHGRCGKRAFVKTCPALASKEEAAQAEQHLASIAHVTAEGEFTVRDEANTLTAFAFRNGFLEDLHYAADMALTRQIHPGRLAPDERRTLTVWADCWRLWVSVAFLKGCLDTLGRSPLLPRTDAELQALLEVYLLHRLVDELGNHLAAEISLVRPACEGILQLLQRPPAP